MGPPPPKRAEEDSATETGILIEQREPFERRARPARGRRPPRRRQLFGVATLGRLLAQPRGAMLPGGLGVIQGLYPALVVYAVAYAALPVGREVLRRRANAKVDERNAAREKWRDALAAGGGRTARRLQAARAQTVAQQKVIGADPSSSTRRRSLSTSLVDTSTPLERKFAALEASRAAARAAARRRRQRRGGRVAPVERRWTRRHSGGGA